MGQRRRKGREQEEGREGKLQWGCKINEKILINKKEKYKENGFLGVLNFKVVRYPCI